MIEKEKRKAGAGPFLEYLQSDEEILWTGQPSRLWVFSWYDLYYVPVTLFWGLGFSYGMLFTLLRGVPIFVGIMLIGFLFVAQYSIWGRFIITAFIRDNTHYAVTNQRVLALGGGKQIRFSAYDIDSLGSVSIEGNSILFSKYSRSNIRTFRRWENQFQWFTFGTENVSMPPGIFAIPPVDHVFMLLRRAIHDSQYEARLYEENATVKIRVEIRDRIAKLHKSYTPGSEDVGFQNTLQRFYDRAQAEDEPMRTHASYLYAFGLLTFGEDSYIVDVLNGGKSWDDEHGNLREALKTMFPLPDDLDPVTDPDAVVAWYESQRNNIYWDGDALRYGLVELSS